ncbi:hypothetical protein Cst_c24070 [Thermoclostridium stercorarium subsp. stercorarium DSM 8532]|jgi:hypothetical protein|uniref:Uncharacterized protein n=2 Tax=Thermoclostridium stercorarium TaxID=1510 RepID=L7VRF7_THES1|nr:hypothetical protein Cst_c24070 [Thermoclostridium stercorarium subsp. stercorarium DSM 8532]
MTMTGRILNRTKYLWIAVILSVLAVAAAIAFFLYSTRAKDHIPQKGVFVFNETYSLTE